MSFVTSFTTAFVLGFFTPLTAVCVLPLYPAFLSYLSNQLKKTGDEDQIFRFGLIISAGVILSMFLLGLIFTTILEKSLQSVIEIISPIAFIILLIMSILLLFNINMTELFPHFQVPTFKNPSLNALTYGLFFGTIIIPCNPLLIAALFAKSVTITSFIENIISFIFFGIGISFPLVFFSFISLIRSREIIGYFVSHIKSINRITGIVMFVISVYYLIFVFKIFG